VSSCSEGCDLSLKLVIEVAYCSGMAFLWLRAAYSRSRSDRACCSFIYSFHLSEHMNKLVFMLL